MDDLDVGIIIKDIRLELGLTQVQFSAAVKYSQSCISRVERGLMPAPIRLLRNIIIAWPDISCKRLLGF